MTEKLLLILKNIFIIFLKFLKWIMIFIRSLLRFIIYYSGTASLIVKFMPEDKWIFTKLIPKSKKDKEKFPTGFIWLIGIYFACFGIASNRYENMIDRVENKLNAFNTQMATDAQFNYDYLANILLTPCPIKPEIEIFKIHKTFQSFYRNISYIEAENEERLSLDTVERWKKKLGGGLLDSANLKGVNLEDANLVGAKFRWADLSDANLSKADLSDAWLEGAKLINADLQYTILRGVFFVNADLSGAELSMAESQDDLGGTQHRQLVFQGAKLIGARLYGVKFRKAHFMHAELNDADLSEAILAGALFIEADLKGAKLRGADLSEATFFKAKNLTYDQIKEAKTLYRARSLDPFLKNKLKDTHPHLFMKPKD